MNSSLDILEILSVLELYSWKWLAYGCALGLALTFIVVWILRSFVIVQHGSVSLSKQAGKRGRLLEPGLHVLMPWESLHYVHWSWIAEEGGKRSLQRYSSSQIPMSNMRLDLLPFSVLTSDQSRIQVNVWALIRIQDPWLFCFSDGQDNPMSVLLDFIQQRTVRQCRSLTAELLQSTLQIQIPIADVEKRMGVEVTAVEVQGVESSSALENANRQIEVQLREARAAVERKSLAQEAELKALQHETELKARRREAEHLERIKTLHQAEEVQKLENNLSISRAEAEVQAELLRAKARLSELVVALELGIDKDTLLEKLKISAAVESTRQIAISQNAHYIPSNSLPLISIPQ